MVPAVLEETRFRFPAHRQRFLARFRTAIGQHPLEIEPFIECLRFFAQCGYVQTLGCDQRPHHKQPCIDGGNLALPVSLARRPVDEVIEPAMLVG
ncbi:hypothetical protein HRbin15_02601 [bacterium HR15]|nr:hypothetical protein HRbin15_02601 [bacterium HR15]